MQTFRKRRSIKGLIKNNCLNCAKCFKNTLYLKSCLKASIIINIVAIFAAVAQFIYLTTNK